MRRIIGAIPCLFMIAVMVSACGPAGTPVPQPITPSAIPAGTMITANIGCYSLDFPADWAIDKSGLPGVLVASPDASWLSLPPAVRNTFDAPSVGVLDRPGVPTQTLDQLLADMGAGLANIQVSDETRPVEIPQGAGLAAPVTGTHPEGGAAIAGEMVVFASQLPGESGYILAVAPEGEWPALQPVFNATIASIKYVCTEG